MIVNVTDPSTLRLLPPLVITDAELDLGLERLDRALG